MSEELPPDFYEINKHELDRELCEHPRVYHTYAEQLAEAEEALELAKLDEEQAKNELATAEAEADLAVRDNPEHFGLDGDKLREGAVRGAVRTEVNTVAARDNLQKAKRKTIKARKLVNSLTADVKALDHKGRNIGKLVDLFLSDYYAEARAMPKGKGVSKMREGVVDEAFGKRRGK